MKTNQVDIKLGVKGHFKLVKGDLSGQEKVVADFDNLITNAGLDLILQGSTITNACHVGTGTTTPAVGDTTLANRFATKSTSGGNDTSTTDTVNITKSYTTIKLFPVGTFNNTIISEIGMGYTASSPYTVGSRSLILDDNGDPTTLTLLSTEYLKVYYTITLQAPTTDITGTFTMGSLGTINYTARVGKWSVPSDSSYDWLGGLFKTPSYSIIRFSGHYQAGSSLGAVTGSPTNYHINAPYFYLSAYTNGNFYRDITTTYGKSEYNQTPNITEAAIAFGLFSADGGSALFNDNNNAGGFQILFDPYITKVYARNETYCSFTLKARVSLARV